MPRGPRIELAGGVHHVWQRGNNRQTIFRDEPCRRFFLRLMRESGVRHECRYLSYCLMGNHFHLVVETLQPTLGRAMHAIESRYARWFNQRYETGGGYLFQERFQSRPVTTDEQFGQLLRYVAHNPVKAGLCDSPDAWPWSSHGVLAQRRADRLIATERVAELLEPFGGAPDTRYVHLFDGDGPLSDLEPDVSPWELRPSLAEILGGGDLSAAIAKARDHGYRLAEIAEHTGLSTATVWRRSQTPG
jgi:putative transposase